MAKVTWQCGPAGTTSDDPLDAIERGVGLSLTRISDDDVEVFDVAEVLEPLVRAELQRAHLDEDARAVLERKTGHEAHAGALLRRAIETRQEVIAIADRERRARFVLERARRLEGSSLAADGVRLGARRQIEKARRRGADARARAFRLETLAHLARPSELPIEVERTLRAALEAFLWAETWARLAELPETLPSDVVLTWREVRAELSAELGRRFLPADLRPSTHDAEEPTPPAASSVAADLAGSAEELGDGAPPSRPESEPTEGEPSWAGLPPLTLSTTRLGASPSFALTLRTMSGTFAPPLMGPENAWCALCRMRYELPEDTPILHTSCAVCRQTLIPSSSEPRPRIACDFVARCSHCGHRFRQRTTHRHHRCEACGTAVTPVAER